MTTTNSSSTSASPISESQTHSVNCSTTISSVTLHPNSSSHSTKRSTPYESLLPPINQSTDAISYQPRLLPIASIPRWSESNLKQSSLRDEKAQHTDRKPHSQSKRLRWLKVGLETVMVVWSLYSMFRYLYAFTIYENMNGQLATLGLGICAGLAFAFTCCSTILSAVNRRLLIRGVFVKSLSHVHLILQYPPSFCFLFPAVTNLVLLIVWKNMSNADLSFRHRCKVDVDLLWSITDPSCDNLGQPLAVWLILAIIRIVLSLLIIIAFHNVQSPQVIPMLKLSYVKNTMAQRSMTPKRTFSRQSSKKLASKTTHERADTPTQTTEDSLSNKSSWRDRLRLRPSATFEPAPSYSNTDFLPIPNSGQNESTFVERFRRLVSIITQETDDAVAYARASVGSTSCNSQDTAESPTLNESCQLEKDPNSPEYNHIPTYDDQEDDFYGSPLDERDTNYPESFPADERIPMMNGYIKRMPTIESMGSGELVGSIGTGNTNHERNGPRPSTRNTMLSWNGTEMSGSDPRRRSLTAQAEFLYGMNTASEVGELIKHGHPIKIVGSRGSSPGPQGDEEETLPDYHSSTSGSKSSGQTFHTANSGVDTIHTKDMKISVAEDSNLVQLNEKA